MFKIRIFKNKGINHQNCRSVEGKGKINLTKTFILTIGLLTTLTLVSCSKENNVAISNQSSSISQNSTASKPQLLPLCESKSSLIAYYETRKYWINICAKGEQKSFIKQSKSKPSQIDTLPTYWNEESSEFLANSGEQIYALSGESLKIWQDRELTQQKIINKSPFNLRIVDIFLDLVELPPIITNLLVALGIGVLLGAIYLYGKPHVHRLGSNGRAAAYVLGIVAWPGILVICLTITDIPLGLLAPLTGALALGFSFGTRQVVENVATVALNLRDDVYEVEDIIGFNGDNDFYRVAAIKTSSVKLLSLGGNAGRVLNISPSVLAQKEFVNYTQDGPETLCKWLFPMSLKAQVAQPGKGDMTKMEDALLQAAKEVQTWIVQNTKHPAAQAAFAAEATKEKGRRDIPGGVFLTKVEKFIHHYTIALWIPGVEIYRVASINNELFHHVWHHAVENHDIELATPNTADDTDIVEATQAIALSLRESLGNFKTYPTPVLQDKVGTSDNLGN
ncbi:MAG: hypothetical protein AAFQ80_09310 [Cyanobacteria bacterium J06621_8]